MPSMAYTLTGFIDEISQVRFDGLVGKVKRKFRKRKTTTSSKG